ncbi:CG2113 [Drosophila busckii]|uniref:CG2113 n=1 Tax=Drosophila busckii TaxID=30019 RepID=A0A0M4EMK8_DROBS|nr:actin-binding Rho-activating protein [Drosophila busckii]ALC43005.1 CG2113 [Drosophila busckii]
MADEQRVLPNSVSSRISQFNQQAEQHAERQRINPFAHYNVRDAPKPNYIRGEYGQAPAGSLSEQRALQAQMQSLEEMLQLCELIDNQGVEDALHFGALFELYNHISDKLLGTLLCARKHKFVDFAGETLFQGRDDAQQVRLLRPFDELRAEILHKLEDLRCLCVERERALDDEAELLS